MSFWHELLKSEGGKILLVVLDGLGGIEIDGKTALEKAYTPNMDKVAPFASMGLTIPVEYGITPGSGPAHLALFGYDPLEYNIGRGILEALGIGLNIAKGELVARGNFATQQEGIIIDRRAGRISTELNRELIEKLNSHIENIEGIDISFYSGIEHRFVVKLVGDGLNPNITDADPQKPGYPLPTVKPLTKEAGKTARIVNHLILMIEEVLRKEDRANSVLLRGFSTYPDIPTFSNRYKISSMGIAAYPMYIGLASLVGMDIPSLKCKNFKEELNVLKNEIDNYDFFFLHYKYTDKAGEDGDFEKKVKHIEAFDMTFSDILDMGFDVIAVTGDHSTPAFLKGHSFHPNPLMILSKNAREDGLKRFSEKNARYGSLGVFYAKKLMLLLLGHALRLKKYGA